MPKKHIKPTVHARVEGGAHAVQVDGNDGSHVAVFENLRVLITKEDGTWLAQGLEVDYAVDGESLADVKKRFEDGLAMTIVSNLRVHQTIKPLLQVAPQEVWDRWNDAKNMLRRFQHSMMIMTPQRQQELPFDKIVWLDTTLEEGADTPRKAGVA